MWYSVREKMQRFFKEYDLDITAKSNQKFVNYIEVTINLKDALLDSITAKKSKIPFNFLV